MTISRSTKIGILLLTAGLAFFSYSFFSVDDSCTRDGACTSTTIELLGNVDVRQVSLAFKVPGRLQTVYVEEGDRVEKDALIGLFMYMVPAILLSGYATPIENMPDWLQDLTQTNPITHFIIICRGIFLKEAPAMVIWHHLWPMILISLVSLSGAAWLFKKKTI